MSTGPWITAVLVTLALAGVANGGEFQFHPSITVSEEYTDNVFETSGNRIGDFITRGLPGIRLSYISPALEADINYLFDYRYYAKRSRSTDQTHDLSASARLTVVENLLFLDVNDRYRRVSLDVTKDVTQESLFVNQEDQNVVSASPYITLRPVAQATLKTGYRFVDTRYFGTQGIDKTDHIGFLEATYEFSEKWKATCGYSFIHEDAATNDFDQHQPYLGFRYEYADKSFLFGQAGYTWTMYTDGHRLNNPYWNAGFAHAFETFTATINTGVRYNEDPLRNITKETFVTGGLEKPLQRGSLSLFPYYSEYALAETNTLETRKYGGTAQGRYEITPLLNASLRFTAERYDHYPSGSYTRRFVVDSLLSYLLAETVTVSLRHVFTDSYSPDIATDTHQVNRIIVAVSKKF